MNKKTEKEKIIEEINGEINAVAIAHTQGVLRLMLAINTVKGNIEVTIPFRDVVAPIEEKKTFRMQGLGAGYFLSNFMRVIGATVLEQAKGKVIRLRVFDVESLEIVEIGHAISDLWMPFKEGLEEFEKSVSEKIKK